MQLIRFAFSFALAKAGKSNPARIAMIAITTSNSINVKARERARKNFGLKAEVSLKKGIGRAGFILAIQVSVERFYFYKPFLVPSIAL